MSRSRATVTCMSALVVLWSVGAAAADVAYPDFSDPSGLNMNGSAGTAGPALRLTSTATYHRGSAWYQTKQSVGSEFDTTFAFQITGQGGSTGYYGSDGLAFVIQNDSPTALGGPGSAKGYATANEVPGIPNSLAIDFTSKTCPEPTGHQNYVSVQTRGLEPNGHELEYSLGRTTAIPELGDTLVHTARIQYAAGMLNVFVDDLVNPVLGVSVTLSETLSLDAGRAWVGFSAGCGEGYQNHDILNWTFVPEPSAVLLLAFGLAVARRRA